MTCVFASQVIQAKDELCNKDGIFDESNIVLSLGDSKLDTMVIVGKLVNS